MLSPGSLRIPHLQPFFILLLVCEVVPSGANTQEHFQLGETPGWAGAGCMFALSGWAGQDIRTEPWV